jgi:hypothetical protein
MPRTPLTRRCAATLAGSLIAAMLATATGCTTVTRPPTATRIEAPAGQTRLPGGFEGGLFVAEATIDGTPGFRMLIDTGADASVLTPEAMGRLSGERRSAVAPTFGGAGGVGMVRGQRRIERLRIGDLVLEGFDAAEVDLSRVQRAFTTPIDGVVGWPAFRDVVLEFDYPGEAVRVERPAERPEAGGPGQYALVGSRAVIRVPFHRGAERVTIDTGANDTLSVRERDIEPGRLERGDTSTVTGVNARRRIRTARITGGFEFAGERFRDLPVSLTTGSRVMGSRMMQPFVVRFDQPAGLIEFERVAPGLAPEAGP